MATTAKGGTDSELQPASDSVSGNTADNAGTEEASKQAAKKTVKFGEVKEISASDRAKMKKIDPKKTTTSLVHGNFHMLHAGAEVLKKSFKPTQKKATTDSKNTQEAKAPNKNNNKTSKDDDANHNDNAINGESTMDCDDPSDKNNNDVEMETNDNAERSKQKSKGVAVMGEVKSIAASDMASISSDVVKKQSQMVAKTVHKNFLMLHAGASALLPQKAPKRKPDPKEESESGEANEKSATETTEREYSKASDEKDIDTSSDYESNKKVIDKYYCEICDTPLNSEQTYISHIEGKKHQKKLKAQEQLSSRGSSAEDLQYMKVKEGCRINRVAKPKATPHIQSQIEGLNTPCVGLNFVSEIWRMDDTQDDCYYCALCCTTCQPVTIISHIIGYKHRLAYMKLFDPVNYEKVKKMTTKKSDLTTILENYAASLEKVHGPGQLKVEEEVDGYVPPLETGRCFAAHDDPASSAHMIQPDDLAVLSPRLRIQFVEEAVVNCDSSEIVSRHQVAVLQRAIENLKESLVRYQASDPLLQQRIMRLLTVDASSKMSHEMPRSMGREPQRFMDLEPQRPIGFERQHPMGFESQHSMGFESQRSMEFESPRSMGFESQRSMGLEPRFMDREQPRSGYQSSYDNERMGFASTGSRGSPVDRWVPGNNPWVSSSSLSSGRWGPLEPSRSFSDSRSLMSSGNRYLRSRK